MRVNVLGRGAVSGVGILPVRDIELSTDAIKRILNFKNAKVYDANTGELITKKYFERKAGFVTKALVPSKPVPAPVIEEKKPAYVPPVLSVKKEDIPVEVTPTEIFEKPVFTPYITEPVDSVDEISPADDVETTDEDTEVSETESEDDPTEEITPEETVETTDGEEEVTPVRNKKRRRR